MCLLLSSFLRVFARGLISLLVSILGSTSAKLWTTRGSLCRSNNNYCVKRYAVNIRRIAVNSIGVSRETAGYSFYLRIFTYFCVFQLFW
jgi:hypothetical protein